VPLDWPAAAREGSRAGDRGYCVAHVASREGISRQSATCASRVGIGRRSWAWRRDTKRRLERGNAVYRNGDMYLYIAVEVPRPTAVESKGVVTVDINVWLCTTATRSGLGR